MTQADRKLVADGRIFSGPKAMAGPPRRRRWVIRMTPLRKPNGWPGALRGEVVIFQRGLPDPIHLRHNPQRPHAIRPDPDQYARVWGSRWQVADLPLSVAA